MGKAANLSFSLCIPLAVGLSIGMIIFADPYLSVYIPISQIKNFRADIPYLFSLSIFGSLVLIFAFIMLVNKIARQDSAKTFIVLFIIGMQTVALSPIPKIQGSDVVLLVYSSVFLISCMIKQKTFKITLFDILNLGFVSALFLSTINGEIVPSVINLISALMVVALSFLLVNFCTTADALRFLVKWLIIITTLSAIIGILQEVIFYFTGILLIGFIEQKNLRHMFEPTSFGTLVRIPALTDTYVFLAYFLTNGIVMALNILLYTPVTFKRKFLLYAALAIMFVALTLTFSRYSLLALFTMLPWIILARWPAYSTHLIATFVFLSIVIYLTGYHKDIFDIILQEITWGEFRMRLQLNRDGIFGFIHQHPFIGAGLVKSPEYTSNFYGWGAHNAFIRVAGDAGLLGLFLYCLLCIYSFIKAFAINLRVKDATDKGIARGLFFCLCTFFMLLQFDSVYIVIFFWFILGTIKAADLIYTKQEMAVVSQD
ncbi:MAG: O-antigen ligase family protein [Candidatus Brocadia sp.]